MLTYSQIKRIGFWAALISLFCVKSMHGQMEAVLFDFVDEHINMPTIGIYEIFQDRENVIWFGGIDGFGSV